MKQVQGVVCTLISEHGDVVAEGNDFSDSKPMGMTVVDMQKLRSKNRMKIDIKHRFFCSYNIDDWLSDGTMDSILRDMQRSDKFKTHFHYIGHDDEDTTSCRSDDNG